jgi:hypothetical protein
VTAAVLQVPPSAFTGRLRAARARELAAEYARGVRICRAEAEKGGENVGALERLAAINEARAIGAAAVVGPLLKRELRGRTGWGNAA